jgi:hypothetical protein
MTQPNRKRRWYRLGALLLLLLIGYGTYRAVRPNPNLKKVKQLQAEFAAHAKEWSPDQRQAKGREMRTAMEKLSTDQRQALAAERRKRMQDDMERYRQMSAADKKRYLDDRINQMEKMRQEMAQRNANGKAQAASGPGPNGNRAPMSDEDRDRRRKERLDQTTPEFRALMDQFRKDMAARRQQRGLPVMTRG